MQLVTTIVKAYISPRDEQAKPGAPCEPLGRSRVEDLKGEAGREASGVVSSGMRLGLGTGSTVAHFLRHLAARIACDDLVDVVGVPTSIRTEKAARGLGIPLGTLSELAPLDLTVDGADEVDPELNLIKGLGGALLREKMVAQASARFIVIVDDTKLVNRLGERSPVPVEVVTFECSSHMRWLRALGADPEVRRDEAGDVYLTDNGHLIVDCHFVEGVADPLELESRLAGRAGVVESGLFLEMADEVVVAGGGGVRRVRRGGD